MKTIGDITNKRRQIYSVDMKDSVRAAAEKMSKWDVRAVCVTDRGNIAGIVSEWDFLTKVVAQGLAPETVRVEQIMTHSPQTTSPEASYAECLVTMLKNDFQHLVVVTHSGELRGTVALGDLLKVDKSERDELIDFYSKLLNT